MRRPAPGLERTCPVARSAGRRRRGAGVQVRRGMRRLSLHTCAAGTPRNGEIDDKSREALEPQTWSTHYLPFPVRPRRAQCDAPCALAGSFADAVRGNAVGPDDGDEENQQRECADQEHLKALLRHRRCGRFIQRAHGIERHGWIYLVETGFGLSQSMAANRCRLPAVPPRVQR